MKANIMIPPPTPLQIAEEKIRRIEEYIAYQTPVHPADCKCSLCVALPVIKAILRGTQIKTK